MTNAGTLQRFEGHNGRVLGAAVTSDGEGIISADSTGTVLVRDIQSAREINRWTAETWEEAEPRNKELVRIMIDIEKNRGWLSTLSENELDSLYDRRLAEAKQDWENDEPLILCVAISEDSHFVLSGDRDGRAWLLDTKTGDETCVLTAKGALSDLHEEPAITSVAFSPNKDELFCGDLNGTVWQLRITKNKTGANRSRRIAKFKRFSHPVVAMAVSPNGKWMIAADRNDYDNTSNTSVALLWGLVAENKMAVELLAGGPWRRGRWHLEDLDRGLQIHDLDWSPDGRWIALAGYDYSESLIRIHDLLSEHTYQIVARIDFHDKNTEIVSKIAFSSDGEQIVSTDWGGITKVWDFNSRRELYHLDAHESATPYPIDMSSIAFSHDKNQLVIGEEDGSVWLWTSPE